MKTNLSKNILGIKKKIFELTNKRKYNSHITIVAATKTQSFSTIKQCYDLGIQCIGENRVQEAEKKFESFEKMPDIQRRFIGHLQRNKVKKCLNLFDTIDSIDSLKLAKKISNTANQSKKKVIGLIEINTSKEPQKKGFNIDNIDEIIACLDLPNLEIKGLMTLGPNTKEKTEIRESFSKLRSLKDQINTDYNKGLTELSMGMSGDYDIAIEEGSTMVRLGTVLFGSRNSL